MRSTHWLKDSRDHDTASTMFYRRLQTLAVVAPSWPPPHIRTMILIGRSTRPVSIDFKSSSGVMRHTCFPSLRMASWEPSFPWDHSWWGFSEQQMDLSGLLSEGHDCHLLFLHLSLLLSSTRLASSSSSYLSTPCWDIPSFQLIDLWESTSWFKHTFHTWNFVFFFTFFDFKCKEKSPTE